MVKIGSGKNGADAKLQSIQLAAAIPKMAGDVPRTGMVLMRKFGIICKICTES
jgi:hypothetical protein